MLIVFLGKKSFFIKNDIILSLSKLLSTCLDKNCAEKMNMSVHNHSPSFQVPSILLVEEDCEFQARLGYFVK